MKRPTTIALRPAVTLVYLLQVLGLMSVLMGLVLWGFISQMDVQRRLVRSAERRLTRQTILRQLRADLAQTRALRVSEPAGATPTPAESKELVHVLLETAAGVISYTLNNMESDDHVDRSHGAVRFGQQMLSRRGPQGDERLWLLNGQQLRLLRVAESARPALRAEFDVESAYGGGQRFIKRFATTLCAGDRS